MKRLLLLSALAFAAFAPNNTAQEILILGANGDLHSIDPDTGNLSLIGFTGVHTHFWSAMSQDSQGRLFAAYGRYFSAYEIYEIDPNTGQATFVTQTNLFGVGSMAFGPGDTLFLGNDRNAPSIPHKYDLYTCDLATGATTLVGNTGARNMLAMDYSNGVLWGYASENGLLQINPITGTTTDVNPNFTGPLNATVSMCFDDEGSLFYIDGALWMLDPESGVASAINNLSTFGFWGEAVFVEGPSAHFSLWVGGVTGGPMDIKFSGASPNGRVAIAWTKGNGGPTPIPAGNPCAGTLMDLNSSMQMVDLVTAGPKGKSAMGPQFVPAAALGIIRLQALDLTTCATSNPILISY